MNTITMQATRWLAAIACEFDDYVIVEACFSDTADTLINAIYEVYCDSYGDIETWSISVAPCNEAEQFRSQIIPFPEITEEERERVRYVFFQKFAAKYPNHPWIQEL